MHKKIAVVGAGASGLSAAIQVKEEAPEISVTVFERLPKAAKKILATGNGRCNFTNCNLSPKHFYGDFSFLKSVLTSPFSDSEGFFRRLGVLTYIEDDRVYPRSQQASAIREALLSKAESCGVEIIVDSPVEKIRKKNDSFVINNETFDAVIISGGGKASPVHGSDGSAYSLLTGFGHTLTPLYPALNGILTADKALNSLKGVRAECDVELYSGNTLLGYENGEIQFTDKAISGIPVMNLSHLCENRKNLKIVLDLCPEYSEQELREHLISTAQSANPSNFETVLNGIINSKLCYIVMSRANVSPQTKCPDISNKKICDCVTQIKSFEVPLKCVKGFESAQITKGGIKTDEFFTNTLMSKKQNGVFACGEILDIHGDCGGYNLHLAWTTGRIAGTGAIAYLENKE